MATHSRWPDILSAIAHARCQRTRRATNACLNARAAQNPAFARPRRDVRVHARCTTNSRAPCSKDQRARTRDARFGVFREASALVCRSAATTVARYGRARKQIAVAPDKTLTATWRDRCRRLAPRLLQSLRRRNAIRCVRIGCRPTRHTHTPHQAATPPSERGSVPPCNMPLASRRIAPAWPTASSNAPSTSTS